MKDTRAFEICEPAPFIYYENGQFAMTDGTTVYQVIVTCEAMKATAPPPEKSLSRLVRFAGYYRDLAVSAIRRGEEVDGKVWVNEAMVRSAMPLQSLQPRQPAYRRRAAAEKETGHAQHGA